MSPLSIRLEAEDRARLEELRQEISKRRRRPVSLSTVLRIVIGAGLKAQETVFERAHRSRTDVPEEPRRRWEKFVAPIANAAQEQIRTKQQLQQRFERYCDARDITPVEFARTMKERGCTLSPKVLYEWYYRATLPDEKTMADTLVSALEEWIGTGRR